MAISAQREHRFYRTHRLLNRFCNLPLGGALLVSRVIAAVVLATTTAMIILIQFIDPTDQEFPKWLEAVLDEIYKHRLEIVSVLVVVEAAFRILAFFARRWGSNYQLVIPVLNELVDSVFSDDKKDIENHHYRASLFKVRKFEPFGMWLGIIARSGQMYHQKQTIFSIRTQQAKNCTGIAGECWRREGRTLVKKLADCREKDDTDGRDEVEVYQRKGYLDSREFNSLNLRSCVFIATGIRVDGRLRFILVVDSTDESTYPKTRRYLGPVKLAVVAIEHMLK